MAHGKNIYGGAMTLKRKLFIVLAMGLLLITIDYIVSTSAGNSVFRDSNGNVLIIRPDQGKSSNRIFLNATVKDGDGTYTKGFEISVDPYSKDGKKQSDQQDNAETASAMSSEELISYELRSAVSEINDDISTRKILLPSSLATGEKIYWSTETKTNTAPIAFMVMITCFILYKNRLSPIKKAHKIKRDSITRQLPEFVNRLVLLLNAGLVLSAAFERSVEESLNSDELEDDYFYGKLREIHLHMKETNSPLNQEFRAFAKESGDNGLMRISNILSDNISKGVALTEKLQRESEVLWVNRKRDCEERGRLSETKLTLPLTIFLLVLIILTVSPALLELQ